MKRVLLIEDDIYIKELLEIHLKGLNLTILKKILEIYDQTIQLTSRLNEGSTFTFQLPQYQNA